MDRRTPFMAALLLSLGSLAAAADSARSSAPADSLFARLGGAERVTAFVDATVDELAANADAGNFRGGRVEDIKADLVARICAVTGGGCRYRSKAGSKAGSKSSLQTGKELVEALRVAMRTHGVPLAARNELLEALAPTRDVAKL